MKFQRSAKISALLVAGFLAPVAAAQQAPGTDIQRQVDDAFRQVLSSPGDVGTGYRYARLLIDSGNFEGGIAALERLLLDPNASPTIRLELAVLYYRLGSYATAESYARAAMADSRLDEKLRGDARRLADDASRRTQVHQLTGSVTAGLRGQTNPTAAPESDLIRSLGLSVPRPDNVKAKSDFDAQLSGRAEHVWDFGRQDRLALVSTLSGFANHYFDGARYGTRPGKTDGLDLAILEGTSGLRFQPFSQVAGFTVRPYLLAADVLLTGRQYFASWGGGVDLSYRFDEGAGLLEGSLEVRQNEYTSRADVSDADAQSGPDSVLRLRALRELAPGRVLVGELALRDHSTDRDYFDYQSADARVSFIFNYANPLGFDGRLWTTTPYTGVVFRGYGGPDPTVAPGTTREDTEWRVGFWNQIPVSDTWSVLIQAEYARIDSNLSNYEYENGSAMVGMTWRF